MIGTHRILLGSGALILFLAVVLGAIGAHGLQGSLSASAWSAYQTAIQYQFTHGLGLLATTFVAERYPASRLIAASSWLLLIGIVLFCGSIYATAFGAPASVGSLAPYGGTAFMLGWLAFGLGVLRVR